jgi:hypothetical protein
VNVKNLVGSRFVTTDKWEDNIKIYIKEIGCEDVDWIHQAQDRVHCLVLVNMLMKLWVSCKVVNFLTS